MVSLDQKLFYLKIRIEEATDIRKIHYLKYFQNYHIAKGIAHTNTQF